MRVVDFFFIFPLYDFLIQQSGNYAVYDTVPTTVGQSIPRLNEEKEFIKTYYEIFLFVKKAKRFFIVFLKESRLEICIEIRITARTRILFIAVIFSKLSCLGFL